MIILVMKVTLGFRPEHRGCVRETHAEQHGQALKVREAVGCVRTIREDSAMRFGFTLFLVQTCENTGVIEDADCASGYTLTPWNGLMAFRAT